MEAHAVPKYVAFAGDVVVKFPKYVVFKGDNDKYLAASWTKSHEYLQFNSTDIGSGLMSNKVVEVGDGTSIVMLKCLHWNKFWRRGPNWIWVDMANANSYNKDMLFQPIKVDDNRVALQSLGNNWFCKRLTIEGKMNCLNAGTSSLESTAILHMEEPVLSWRVHSVEYHVDTSSITDSQSGSLFKAIVHNPFDQPATLQVAYAYMQKKSTSWRRGVSFTTGVKTTFQVKISFVVEGEVEVSAKVTMSGEWEKMEETETTIIGTYDAPIKAVETVEVMVMGVHAKCNVQFSYTQEDLLTLGEMVVTRKDDGLFTRVNTTDVKF